MFVLEKQCGLRHYLLDTNKTGWPFLRFFLAKIPEKKEFFKNLRGVKKNLPSIDVSV